MYVLRTPNSMPLNVCDMGLLPLANTFDKTLKWIHKQFFHSRHHTHNSGDVELLNSVAAVATQNLQCLNYEHTPAKGRLAPTKDIDYIRIINCKCDKIQKKKTNKRHEIERSRCCALHDFHCLFLPISSHFLYYISRIGWVYSLQIEICGGMIYWDHVHKYARCGGS